MESCSMMALWTLRSMCLQDGQKQAQFQSFSRFMTLSLQWECYWYRYDAITCVQALSTLSSQGAFSVTFRRTDARHHQKHIHKDANHPWEMIQDPPRTVTHP